MEQTAFISPSGAGNYRQTAQTLPIQLQLAEPSTVARVLPNSKEWRTPSTEEVLEFGINIGINPIHVEYISKQVAWGRTFWWEYLHELAHYAVKDNHYIDYWWRHGGPGGVPNLNWSIWGTGLAVPYPAAYQHPIDETPDEYGVRAWSLLALEFNCWLNPLSCSREWAVYTQKWGGRNRYWLWSRDCLKSAHHPNGDGFDQLKAVGIDFSREDLRYLRPTVEASIGTQPVVNLRRR